MRFICIASGPSLSREDVEAARGKAEVIAVNDSWRLAPWAEHLYASDAKWWRHHGDQVAAEFPGRRWTQIRVRNPQPDELEMIQRYQLSPIVGRWEPGLGESALHYGSNSGYQAINLAYLLGATKILLLGYDMQRTGGQEHWFGKHPTPLNCGPDYNAWIPGFDQLATDLAAKGVEVINCTRETALTCFPRRPLAEALREPETADCAGQ